jgi:hypothetical protein
MWAIQLSTRSPSLPNFGTLKGAKIGNTGFAFFAGGDKSRNAAASFAPLATPVQYSRFQLTGA